MLDTNEVKQRRIWPRRRRSIIAAGGTIAVGVGAIVGLVISSTPTAAIRASKPDVTSQASAAKTAATVDTIAQPSVLGYSSSQAAAAVSSCSPTATASGTGDTGDSTGVLADTATDSSGTLLVIASTTGWSWCEESAGGTYTPSSFRSYASTDGWGFSASASDTPAAWLAAPVEVDASSVGLESQADLSTWLEEVVGRASSDVSKVTVGMPDGTTTTVPVQNGFFVARLSLNHPPAKMDYPSGVPFPIIAYNTSGAVLYNSMTTANQTTSIQLPPPCLVTPSGSPVTPPTPGQKCEIGTPWAPTYMGTATGN